MRKFLSRYLVQHLRLRIAGVDNLPHEPAGAPIPDRSAKDGKQDVVIDAGEVLREVSLEDIAILPAKL